jgi:hypothetical protein
MSLHFNGLSYWPGFELLGPVLEGIRRAVACFHMCWVSATCPVQYGNVISVCVVFKLLLLFVVMSAYYTLRLTLSNSEGLIWNYQQFKVVSRREMVIVTHLSILSSISPKIGVVYD